MMRCIYCRGDGFHGDEFTGGECYCQCPAGVALKLAEDPGVIASHNAGDCFSGCPLHATPDRSKAE